MKPPKDIDTPLTKRCKTWKELKEHGVYKDGILYLPQGISTGNLPIEETKSFQNEGLHEINKSFINIEKINEHEKNKLTTDYLSEE